jgi:hypothetical protein
MQAMVNQPVFDSLLELHIPITRELSFLTQRTGQDELTLLSQALHLGLNLLYRQAAEQAFIDGVLTRTEAVAALGLQRVADIAYAKQALAQDVARGLGQ